MLFPFTFDGDLALRGVAGDRPRDDVGGGLDLLHVEHHGIAREDRQKSENRQPRGGQHGGNTEKQTGAVRGRLGRFGLS